MGNAFGNAIASNIMMETNDGQQVQIQDLVEDPQTGQVISELPFDEKLEAINGLKNTFRDKLEKDLLIKTFMKKGSFLSKILTMSNCALTKQSKMYPMRFRTCKLYALDRKEERLLPTPISELRSQERF